MNCPVDGERLVMSERSGVEIDYCPACRGVWLDRGELDKIVERAEREWDTPRTPPQPQPQYQAPPPQYGHGYYKPKKRKSFLSELFDD